MKIPDRETARHIIWITDGLLSYGGNALPVGLMAALREYKSALLEGCAQEHWARTGQRTRYGILADLIGQQIMNGEWGPGERMPSASCLAARHAEKRETADRAMHILAVRGQLALEFGSYYVIPRGTHYWCHDTTTPGKRTDNRPKTRHQHNQ
jgi:DNA-binding FadR family transcriptional regulator